MRILFAISILALVALLSASIAIVQHVRRSRRRRRRFQEENATLPTATTMLGLTPPAANDSGKEVSFTEVSPFRTVSISRGKPAAPPPPLPPSMTVLGTVAGAGFPSTASAFDPETLTLVSALVASNRATEAADQAAAAQVKAVARDAASLPAMPTKLPRAEPEPRVAVFAEAEATTVSPEVEAAREIADPPAPIPAPPEPVAEAATAPAADVEPVAPIPAEADADPVEAVAVAEASHEPAPMVTAESEPPAADSEPQLAAEDEVAEAAANPEPAFEPEAAPASVTDEAQKDVAEFAPVAAAQAAATVVPTVPPLPEQAEGSKPEAPLIAASVAPEPVPTTVPAAAKVAEVRGKPPAAAPPRPPVLRKPDAGPLHVTSFASLAAVAAKAAAAKAPYTPPAAPLTRMNSGKHPLAQLVPPTERPDWAYFNKDMGDLSDPTPPRARTREQKALQNLKALKERHKQA